MAAVLRTKGRAIDALEAYRRFFFSSVLDLNWEYVINEALISEDRHEEEQEAEEQSAQPTAKIGAKKQRKLEEKQARKAQREVRGRRRNLLDTLAFSTHANSVFGNADVFKMKNYKCQIIEVQWRATWTLYRTRVWNLFEPQMEMEEREERKRMQELREQEKRQDEERERLLEQKQVSQQLLPPRLLYKKTVSAVLILIDLLLKKHRAYYHKKIYIKIWNDGLKFVNAATNVQTHTHKRHYEMTVFKLQTCQIRIHVWAQV